MRNKLIYLLVAAAVLLTSCQKHYVKEYGLEVDATAYVLPYTGDVFPLYIYCSSDWTVSFDAPVEWIRFENGVNSGRGTSLVHLEYDDNDDALREVNVIVSSGELSKIINISQKFNSTHLEIE